MSNIFHAAKHDQEMNTLRARIAELETWQREMVEKAADTSLAGYRELGRRAAVAEIRAEQAEAALVWYTRWASVRLARERGGSWSSRSDTERFNLIVQAAVDLETARAEEGSGT